MLCNYAAGVLGRDNCFDMRLENVNRLVWQCKNKDLVSCSQICNGGNDCSDGSDEHGCNVFSCLAGPNRFLARSADVSPAAANDERYSTITSSSYGVIVDIVMLFVYLAQIAS